MHLDDSTRISLAQYVNRLADAAEQAALASEPRPPARRSGRRVALAIGAAALIAATLGAGLLIRQDNEPEPNVQASEPEAGDDEPHSPVDVLDGDWGLFDTSTDISRPAFEQSPSLIVVDDLLLFVRAENGASDVTVERHDLNGEGASLATPSDLPFRVSPSVSWTGQELLIVGGVGSSEDFGVIGKAYDPAADSWRDLASPPGFEPNQRANAITSDASWNGTELVSWEAELAYDPVADQWRTLPGAPFAPRLGEAVASSADSLVVWGGCASECTAETGQTSRFSDGAVLDIANGEWRTFDIGTGGGFAHAIWLGDDRFLIAQFGSTQATDVQMFVLESDTLAIEDVPSPPGAVAMTHPLLLPGDLVAFYGGSTTSGASDQGFLLDLQKGEWEQMPSGPARRDHAIAWTGKQVVIAGGLDTADLFALPN